MKEGSCLRGATSPGATSCGPSNTRTRGSAAFVSTNDTAEFVGPRSFPIKYRADTQRSYRIRGLQWTNERVRVDCGQPRTSWLLRVRGSPSGAFAPLEPDPIVCRSHHVCYTTGLARSPRGRDAFDTSQSTRRPGDAVRQSRCYDRARSGRAGTRVCRPSAHDR